MRIGKEYRDSFNSAVKIISSGLLDNTSFFVNNDIDVDARGKVIRYNQNEFQLDEGEGISLAQNEFLQTTGFSKEGSAWFECVRRPNLKNENADWISFLENLAMTYHKEYSISVQRQQLRGAVKKKQEEAAEIVKDFIRTFFSFSERQLHISNIETKQEYIFGLSLRLDVCGNNAPEPKPVLCKVYFSKNENGEVYPLVKEEAESIINSCVIETDTSKTTEKNQNETNVIINESLRALEKLIEDSNKSTYNFRDYMCCSEIDYKAINDIHARSAHDNVNVECRKVKVLGIINVEWFRYCVEVSLGNMPIFNMNISEDGNNISLACANCGEGRFVINNTIKYKEDGRDVAITLQLDKENFGLSEATIEKIKESKTFREHLILIECFVKQRNNRRCTNIVCGSQAVYYEEQGCWKCQDCDYPEMIYTDKNGKKHLTETLGFACDQRELIPKEEIGICSCCGRGFNKETHAENMCDVCAMATKLAKNVASQVDMEKYHKTYKENAYMFHPLWRLAHMFDKKYCVEGSEILVFVIKGQKYIFNKLSAIGEYGYIESPKKPNKTGKTR